MAIHLIRMLLLTCFLAWPLAAQQVEVHMTAGQVVSGELVKEDDDAITVKTQMVGKTSTMVADVVLKRADIARIDKAQDPETEYLLRRKAATTTAEQLALARWCREKGLADHALELARLAVAQPPASDEALAMMKSLGWIQVDGTWVQEDVWLKASGKTRYLGTIMPIAEAEARKARDQAQKTLEEKSAALARHDKAIAELDDRPAAIDEDLAKATAAQTAAQGKAQQVTSAKAGFDQAQKALEQARNAQGNANQVDLGPLRQLVESTQKAYNAAKRDAGSAENDVARAKATIASLTAEKTALSKKREALAAKRPALAKAVDGAKAALAALGPALSPTMPATAAAAKP